MRVYLFSVVAAAVRNARIRSMALSRTGRPALRSCLYRSEIQQNRLL